jgi:hypothetical protein
MNAIAMGAGAERPLCWFVCFFQAVLLVNIIYFAWMCHLTLPLYSLVVHMGSDLKLEAIPPELRERLARTRARHEARPFFVFTLALANPNPNSTKAGPHAECFTPLS